MVQLYLGPFQTPKIKLFAKIVDSFASLNGLRTTSTNFEMLVKITVPGCYYAVPFFQTVFYRTGLI